MINTDSANLGSFAPSVKVLPRVKTSAKSVPAWERSGPSELPEVKTFFFPRLLLLKSTSAVLHPQGPR